MSSPVVISDQFLLWSQLLLLWTIAAYGVTPDPLHGETTRFRWTRWIILLIVRVIVSAALAFVLSSSLSLSALMLCISLFRIAVAILANGVSVRVVLRDELRHSA